MEGSCAVARGKDSNTVTVPACMAVMSVTYTSLRAQALTLVFIWLAAPRGVADIYVSLCFGPI